MQLNVFVIQQVQPPNLDHYSVTVTTDLLNVNSMSSLSQYNQSASGQCGLVCHSVLRLQYSWRSSELPPAGSHQTGGAASGRETLMEKEEVKAEESERSVFRPAARTSRMLMIKQT